jgi:LytS/YehU family sensor histidine kinase
MLDDLITYLRAALPQLREPSSTLEREAALARAYLGILQVGVGERLSFSFDVPEPLRDARIPAMLLLPLIQHALARGTAPGASRMLSVTAVAAGTHLRVAVATNDGGFDHDDTAGSLAPIAQRVAALYGDRGAFWIEPALEGGARAVLEVPREDTHGDHR